MREARVNDKQREQRGEDVGTQLADPHIYLPPVDLAVYRPVPKYDLLLYEV